MLAGFLKAGEDVCNFDANGQETSEIKICQIDEFKLLDFKDVLVCGTYTGKIENVWSSPLLNEYSAEKIAKLAYKKINNGEFTEPNDFKPLYIQDFIVKTKRKELNI